MTRDNSATRRFLADAGVAPGQRVLEIGCGGGEVTEALVELVGPRGAVVAVDRDTAALGRAADRLAPRGSSVVEWLSADVAGALREFEHLPHESFDAVVGRRVLMYLPHPAEVLRRLSAWLTPGGVAAFEESDGTMVPASTAPRPAHDQAVALLRRMLEGEGAHTAMGFALPMTFHRAGLRHERIQAEAVIQGQGTQYPLAGLLSLVAPRLVAQGLGRQDDLDALVTRIEAEAGDQTGVYVSDMTVRAWARRP